MFIMARPQKCPKTGTYLARKSVPAALRSVVGKWELMESLRTKDPAEARRLFPEVLIRFDNILASARAQVEGRAIPPTPRQIAELAGEVYREQVELTKDEPGTVEERGLGMDLLREEMDHRPSRRRYREAEALLSARGFAMDPTSVDRMARAIVDARLRAEDVALSRARGDWTDETHGARFPRPAPSHPAAPLAAPPSAPSRAALTTDALLEKFGRENEQQPKTLAKRKAALLHLERAAGHNDTIRVTKDDVRAMKEARLAAGVSTVTVAAEIGTLRPLWTWGLANGLLPAGDNPFSGMTPKAKRGAQAKRLPFDDDEAALMLRDARTRKGWKRWLPWLLAFTGARLEEACGADAADVRQVRGVWCFDIVERPGRTLKTAQAQRLVPLHSALIDEGFLAYAQKLPKGSPLFPDLRVGSWARRSSVATKHLGRWLRGLGIKNPQKVAGHSWRHRMKDSLRFGDVSAEAADAILGHDNPTNAGSGYGEGWRGRPDKLAVELAKIELPPDLG